LRGPAQLALDLLDELTDLGGGGFSLFALDADERRLMLLIIEQDVENAVGHQRYTDDCDEQRDVFGEQAPAGFCDGGFGRCLLRRVGISAPQAIRGTPRLNEIANRHDEHSIKRWPTLSSPPRDAARSFDHLVGERDQFLRHVEAKRLGSL